MPESPPSLPFAEVAVNSGQPARRAFTYSVPAHLDPQPGQAVFVPYGPRVLQGIVLSRAETTDLPTDQLRAIEAIADPAPVLDAAHIELARWLSESYLAPLWECVAVSLPSGYGQRSVTMVSPVEIPPLFPIDRQDRRILQHIGAHGAVTLEALHEALHGVTMARLRRLQSDGHLTVVQGLARPAGHPKLERRVELLRSPVEATEHAAQLEAAQPRSIMARILRKLAETSPLALRELRESGATVTHLATLAEEGWVRRFESSVERDPLAGMAFKVRPPLALTVAQRSVADAIWEGGGEWLLHGVTGSGKTEVYLDLVTRTLAAGKGVIILVPEIALTPQAVQRYGERFGETLAVIHSGLGAGELYDQWYRIQRGDARVVVGSRSGLFAPVQRLGLVVLDEEHEWSYKQENPQPRYHARETARELCRISGARLVLGSATPDVVTYHHTETGLAQRAELPDRVAPIGAGDTSAGRLPHITVVDMRDQLRIGNRSVFSVPLARAIERALERGEQSILFVNRRGSARFMLCRACGHLPKCPTCDLPLSLDLGDPLKALIRCHHCGRQKRLESECPNCGSAKYRPFGVGTQRIEQDARVAFPGARVARWDSDVASRKGSHERMLTALEGGEIDILVGTQMLAKGLDLPAMMVVGVVDGDVGLSLPDFHAQERTFQLLSQVAGRAGRRDREGLVFIQTYEPDATPIVCAANHDYRGFYEDEIAHRRRAGYPPFSRIVRLVYHDRDYEHGTVESSRVASELRLKRDAAGRSEPDILGPMTPYIPRVRNAHRWQILLRGRSPLPLLDGVRFGANWTVDVDPSSLL